MSRMIAICFCNSVTHSVWFATLLSSMLGAMLGPVVSAGFIRDLCTPLHRNIDLIFIHHLQGHLLSAQHRRYHAVPPSPFPYDAGHVKLEGMRTYAGVDD
jgi:hypothetical protein